MTEETFESIILPAMPLKEMVVFPNSITPLFVQRQRSLAALEEALAKDKHVFLVAQQKVETENPNPTELFQVGTVAEVLQVLRVPDGTAKILVEGKYAAKAVDFLLNDRFLQALVVRLQLQQQGSRQIEALKRAILNQFEVYARTSERVPEDLYNSIRTITEPLSLANAIANYVPFKVSDKQYLLELQNVDDKYLLLTQLLGQENELLELENKILGQVKTQIGKTQREYYLQEQLKVIEKELGVGEDDAELAELSEKIRRAQMSKEAAEKAERELQRLARMAPMSPESVVSRSYIEWLTDLPWHKSTKDRIDLARAQKILDEDHYGLKRVKERIVEFLAVAKLVKEMRGPILCFVGPPGVGKTSLGRSIARCINRKFVRVSLGGVRDEAEIRGHRRTYIGALPGKIIQCMKKAGTINPVFLLDEVDKMSVDFRGDPAAALLEVLDPEQNKAFNDHYLEVDYDLSKVLFITTANTIDGIPLPLQDRMEILRLPGYTEDEKRHIADAFLVPRQQKAHGLLRSHVRFSSEAVNTVICNYTREAGVRNLDREIANVCRKIARKIVSEESGKEKTKTVQVDAKLVRELLGPPRFQDQAIERTPEVGLALGMAWTDVGGELLPTETSITRGRGNLLLTGKLGEVMQESAKTALTYIRAHADQYKVRANFHRDTDIHVHIPEGAIPKDGPSAGVTLATSMVSALSGIAVRQDLAMTGEITLRGKVLKIGGLKEKVLAAHRNAIRVIVLPEENMGELEEIGEDVRKEIEFLPVKTLEEVFHIALMLPEK
jgi:ATP-dependent Lon protease